MVKIPRQISISGLRRNRYLISKEGTVKRIMANVLVMIAPAMIAWMPRATRSFSEGSSRMICTRLFISA